MSRCLLFLSISTALWPCMTRAAPLPNPTDASEVAVVEVIGTAAKLKRAAGSGAIIDAQALDRMRPLTINEVLRQVPGIVMRDEEGLGLRPNIGLRGLNPTRSTKVLLLEDGLPAAYAPYGDNASYYHPPVDRFTRIEVLKGVGMLRFGPQTIGGVINYITPRPTQDFSGFAALTVGDRDYFNGHVRLSGNGLLFDAVQKQGDGARDTLALAQSDANFKYVASFAGNQHLTVRANYLSEDSQVGYSGLTEAEYRNFGPRYGFDQNANFDISRYGGSLTHQLDFSDQAMLSTSVYSFRFERDWWRQSSTTTDTQCGNGFRDARLRGERVDFDACNSAQGRLRTYHMSGIEPRLTLNWAGFGAPSEFEVGLRLHDEKQERQQLNGTAPRARSGTLAEDNLRDTRARAGFVRNTFRLGALQIEPIVRVESIDFARTNRLNNRSGEESLTVWIPGVGLNYALPRSDLSLFAGAHRGFAPPRVEDLIDNSGVAVDVGAEDSRNLEFGLRGQITPDLSIEAALFSNHFLRQIAVGSVAGGNTPLAKGETLYQGAEFLAQFSRIGWFGAGNSYLNVALTLLPVARQESPLRAVVGGAPLLGSEAGKRLPYAPKSTLTVRAGHTLGAWDGSIEGVYVGRQFGDFANRTSLDASGQFGEIPAYTIANATLNFVPNGQPFSLFVTAKNLFDKRYVVDRTRGIQVGPPRSMQLGVRYEF